MAPGPSEAPLGYFISFIKGVSAFYPTLGCILFYCIVWFSIISTRTLTEEVKHAQRNSINDWTNLVRDWRNQYLRIMKTVTQINHCFGMYLLIYVTWVFVASINSTFIMLSDLRLREGSAVSQIILIIFIAKELIYFLVLLFASKKLKNEASSRSR